jgi:glycosyltransferase involved in cell wall biosynthesis
LELAKLLRQHDPKSDIRIFAWRTGEDEDIEEVSEGTKIIHFNLPWPSDMYRETGRMFFKDFFLVSSAMLFYLIFALRPLSRILTQPVRIWRECFIEAVRGLSGFILATHEVFYTFSRRRCDVIQAHELFLGMASLFTVRVRRIKAQIIYPYLWLLTEPFFVELEAELVKRIEGAILFDDGMPEVRFRKWGVPKEKVLVTSNIVNCKVLKEILAQKEKADHLKRELGLIDKKVVLYLGRLSPEKGVDQVIVAFPEVLKEIPNAKLVLCGPPAHQAYYQGLLQCIEDLGIKEHVMMVGGVPHSEAPLYYLMADVVVSSSPLSNASLVVREAMLAGKAVVVSNSGGTGRIVRHGETGLVFEQGNLKQFAGNIVWALNNPESSNRLGAAAKRYAERMFCIDEIIPSLLTMYKRG